MENLNLAKNLFKAKLLLNGVCECIAGKKASLSLTARALFLIDEYQRVSPSVLSKDMFVAKSNVAHLCKNLESAGLITVSTDELDKRIIYYSITKSGKEILNERLFSIQDNIKLKDTIKLNALLTELNAQLKN